MNEDQTRRLEDIIYVTHNTRTPNTFHKSLINHWEFFAQAVAAANVPNAGDQYMNATSLETAEFADIKALLIELHLYISQ